MPGLSGLSGLAKPGLSGLAMPLLRVVLHILKFVARNYTHSSPLVDAYSLDHGRQWRSSPWSLLLVGVLPLLSARWPLERLSIVRRHRRHRRLLGLWLPSCCAGLDCSCLLQLASCLASPVARACRCLLQRLGLASSPALASQECKRSSANTS